jgi:hypothetical protein
VRPPFLNIMKWATLVGLQMVTIIEPNYVDIESLTIASIERDLQVLVGNGTG